MEGKCPQAIDDGTLVTIYGGESLVDSEWEKVTVEARVRSLWKFLHPCCSSSQLYPLLVLALGVEQR